MRVSGPRRIKTRGGTGQGAWVTTWRPRHSWSDIAAWLKTGIPDETITEWFSEDVEAAITCCEQVFDGFDDLPDEAQRVLANMAFDLMYGLWSWPRLRSYVAHSNWKGAAESILQSRFATEAPNRCRRLADRLAGIA